ncbi:MAG: hypothetical protein ACYDDF_12095 [Thermoplasmatota archaeon]
MEEDRALEQLRTVQLLETTIGPQSIRQLESMLAERSDNLLHQIEENARTNRALLQAVIDGWVAFDKPAPRAPAPKHESRLTREEILTGFIELKESQAEVLRAALAVAPSERLASLLQEIIRTEEDTATALRELLPPASAATHAQSPEPGA